MDIDSLVPSKSSFLSKDDVGTEGRNLTIAAFSQHEVKSDNTSEMKWTVEWREDYKPMVLNKENTSRLKMIFKTSDTDQMIGKAVNVYNDEFVTFAGKVTGGIRLRPASNGAPQQQQARPSQQAEPWGPTPPVDAYKDEVPW